MLEAGAGRRCAAGHEAALAAADLDVALDLGSRRLVDERPDVRARLEAGAETKGLRPLFEPVDERPGDGLLDDDPAAGRAALARRAERRPEDPVGGEVEVRVGQHDDRVLATELE